MTPAKKISLLSDLKKGDKMKVIRVLADDSEALKKFAAMGVFPGVSIQLLQRTPSFLFRIGHSQFAADKELMKRIEGEIS